MRFEVIDNFLTKEQWQAQHDLVFSTDFKWIYGRKNLESESPFKSIIFQHWFHGDENLTVRDYDPRFVSPADKLNTSQPHWHIMCQPILDKFDVRDL
mgnify:FL=1